jgi:hypothetical protein
VGRIKELQKQRVVLLEEAHEIVNERFRHALEAFELVIIVEKDLLAARLAIAENREERVKACDAAIDNAKAILEIQEAFFNSKRIQKAGVLVAKSLVLEAEIERVKAEVEH